MNEALVEQMKEFLDANKNENKEPVNSKNSKNPKSKVTKTVKKKND